MSFSFLDDHERKELAGMESLPARERQAREPALPALLALRELLPARGHPFFSSRPRDRKHERRLREAAEALVLAPPASAPGWHVLGEAWTCLGEHGRAFAAYERVLYLEPQRPNTLFDLWWLQYWEDRKDEALSTAERLAQIFPVDAEVHVLLGRSLDDLARGEDALRAYSSALCLAPGYWHAHLGIAWALYRAARHAEALPHAERAVAQQPRSGFAHYLLAQVHAALGDGEAALRHLDACLEQQPRHEDALRDKAVILHAQGRAEEALHVADVAVRAASEESELLFLRALLLADLDRHEEAADALEVALLLDHERPERHLRRGLLALELHQPETALHSFHEALRQAPSDAAAHYHLGETLCVLGRYAEAARAFRRTVVFDPESSAAMYAAAAACTLAWDLEAALAWLERAFHAAPELRSQALEDADLEVLRRHPELQGRFARLLRSSSQEPDMQELE